MYPSPKSLEFFKINLKLILFFFKDIFKKKNAPQQQNYTF